LDLDCRTFRFWILDFGFGLQDISILDRLSAPNSLESLDSGFWTLETRWRFERTRKIKTSGNPKSKI